MKASVAFRQDPEELKIEGAPNAGLLPWRANQALISKKFFHAWIYSTIGNELPIAGNEIKNIEITDDKVIVTFEDYDIVGSEKE